MPDSRISMFNLFSVILKYSVLSLMMLGLCFQSEAQPASTQSGVSFLSGTFEKAQQAAKVSRKPLFVEIYLTGCPHCEALAPVLQEASVGKFYNQEFVSWKTEANSEASKVFQKLKGITYPEFPLLLFFSETGELIHMATPQEQKDRQSYINELIQIARIANNPQQRTGGYAARLAAGERDLMFLINYGKYAKALKDPGRLAQINDLLAKVLASPQDMESKAGFYVLQRLTNSYQNPLASYFFSNLNAYRAKYPAKEVHQAGEAIIYHTLYGPKGDTYTPGELKEMRMSMVSLGVSEPEAFGRMLIKELEACFRTKDTQGATQHFERYRTMVKSLPLPDYAYIMKLFNEKATDHSYIDQMPVWATQALHEAKAGDLKTKPAAGLYYELAESYRKAGQITKAEDHARKALETARVSGDDMTRYQALVALLESGSAR